MAEIRLEDVTKRYPDGTEAVKALNLHIADGELMILVGPSGCGKTTALRMIAGLEEITEGRLYIGDRLVNDLSPRDRDIAMIFQNYALYPHMTVRQNMGFSLKLAKVARAEIDRRVTAAAAALDLDVHLDRKPAQLSGGQRQRVAMGRAIVRDPQAFLMDEPLSNLDAKLRVQMRAEVAQTQRRLGATTVFVTHDQTEAMTLGDRVAIMKGGVIQQLDAPQRLYDDPANTFVAGFIGSPPMNLMPATLGESSIQMPFGELPLPRDLRSRLRAGFADGEVVAGLRPEAFCDAASAGPASTGTPVRVRVELVESMGSELLVHCTPAQPCPGSDSARVIARLAPTSAVRAGSETELLVCTDQLRVFDAQSGQSLLTTGTATLAQLNGASRAGSTALAQ